MTNEELFEKFDELAEKLGSNNKAATAVGISPAIISQLRKGIYKGDVEKQYDKRRERKEHTMSMYHKKMSSKRGITIPKGLAFETGIDSGTPVDISSENGRIVISKHTPTCRFCGDKLHAKKFKGLEICPDCAEKLRKEITS